MDSYTELQNKIKALKTQKRTWRDVGKIIGIDGSLAWQVAHGKCDSVVARHYFGLPPKTIEAMPCSVCGELHIKKTCSNKPRKKQYRISLQFETEEKLNSFKEDLFSRGNNRIEQTEDIVNALDDLWDLLREKFKP